MSNKREISVSENRNFEGIWIPAKLYLSNIFNPKEKFLLLEIKSLQKIGDCFATDKHFADFIGVSERMIQIMLSKLKKNGYISVRYDYEENTKAIKKRYLYLTDKYYDEFVNETENECDGGEENFNRGTEKNCDRGGEKNCGDKYNNNIKYNNINNPDKASAKAEVSYKAFFSERKKKAQEKIPYNYTLDEIHIFIVNKLTELNEKYKINLGENQLKSIEEIIYYFYCKYYEEIGERHPILTDESYLGVINQFLQPPDVMIEDSAVYSVDDYSAMIDRFFLTDYGVKSGHTSDYRISYFMQYIVRENLYYRECR